ncbi:hypothetical protein ACTPD5_20670, partial [Clostridioides difficile]
SINNITGGLETAVDANIKNERMKAELITNVSHDLKTPLTSILRISLKSKMNLDIKKCMLTVLVMSLVIFLLAPIIYLFVQAFLD